MLISKKNSTVRRDCIACDALFPDMTTRTDQIYHDVDIEGSKPIKQHPYRMNPMKLQYLIREIQYLLDNDFIEPSQSDWSSPCILVPKTRWNISYVHRL